MKGQGEASHPATISIAARILIATICALFGTAAQAEICREVTADIVAMDQPILFNRLGASNVNGMIFALARDVVAINKDLENGVTGPTQPIPLAKLSAFAGMLSSRLLDSERSLSKLKR